ncbi:hypothetical protein APS_0061 [Acetobacter pasteurianus subsp. pasteurianus LMG 1262 = NBRC 106471]|nr:hypothetical protein APS_0061 [Acetobacter pasteurianus subsp. pasteurianus LMG 1262 = NBRC 106471]CCT60533.1 hypothetical protein APA386B_2496 [Acetobacter pasteurianus 386B]
MLRLLQGQLQYWGCPLCLGIRAPAALALFVFMQFGGIIHA